MTVMRECHAELGNLIHAFEGTLEHCRRRRPGPVQLSDPFPGSLRMARENGCRDAVAAGGAGRKMARLRALARVRHRHRHHMDTQRESVHRAAINEFFDIG
jgi:hypothetical protein